ncbi:MAG: carbon-nitrogen hydrolase family protein [Candidatus Promineifilaceae bacterium]|nr:carbon-nitrogen hydrolase family protein [Candidatus Promineifilaceae bacterium]
MKENNDLLQIGLVQMAPVWLDRQRTLDKAVAKAKEAAVLGCDLIAYGEVLIPGYPFWLERTDGARFNSPLHKEIHAHYLEQAVQIEAGHLQPLQAVAVENQMAIVVGVLERPSDRGGHSVYASLVYITPQGEIGSVHRKLMPTYEERLAWSIGDGHGLRTHRLGAFTVGGLNCWENWMPLPRAALYAQGEDLHVAIWPGSTRNTADITPFLAKEGRSYVLSVSNLMRREDIPANIPRYETIVNVSEPILANGGSCLAGPDGSWIIEPIVDQETIQVATIDHRRVREERQNFDPAGHYSRPDVTRLVINRTRQSTIILEDAPRGSRADYEAFPTAAPDVELPEDDRP